MTVNLGNLEARELLGSGPVGMLAERRDQNQRVSIRSQYVLEKTLPIETRQTP
jgi:hypothetical protein